MTRITKALVLALMATAAISAVMAAGASAQIPGTGLTTFNTTNKSHETAQLAISTKERTTIRATAGGTPSTCEEEKWTGTTSGTEETPKFKPVFAKCHEVIGGSKISSEIHMNGCEFQFHFDKEVSAEQYTGHASIKNCTNPDKSITITTPATGCVIHIPEATNQNINGITYSNITEASPTDVEIVINATNIHSDSTGSLLSCGVSSGTHTTGTLTGKLTVKATNTSGTSIDLTVMKLAT
jgi:hypothetical protein